ncbi:hypothetical protein Ddye_011543 [Dipteronia dyeriana]|uniref:Uncharacterized protein n=1 Tax=Dipteronia dyeriana TaxID=168575 RepID=A0AAE0CH72_9ROSI|nr:hypothetical protein Ddye_011543 [Dipteronia dyeriana]
MCDGLPLALVTIGCVMAGKTMPEEWKKTIQVLKNYPHQEMGKHGSYDEDIGFEEDQVKMHDVLRDMARWITREPGNEILILDIQECEILENLTWLIYTPRLRVLKVMDCESLEGIIARDIL